MITLSYIAVGIAELIVTDLVAHHMLQTPRKKLLFLLILGIIYLSLSVWYITVNYILGWNLLFSALFTLLFCFGYETKWWKRIVITALSAGIGLAAEGILWMAFRMLFQLTGSTIPPEADGFAALNFAAALVEILLALLIWKSALYLQRHSTLLYASIPAVSASFLIGMLLLFVTFAETPYFFSAIVLTILFLAALTISVSIFCNQMWLRLQQEKLRLDFLEKQNQDQIAHYAALYARNNEVHYLHHDLKNFILNARTLLDLKDYEKLKLHLTEKEKRLQPPALSDTGNPMLDAVLSAKQQSASNVDFRVLIPQLHCENIDQMDLAMLLASALDNAIEGALSTAFPYIIVTVKQKGKMISLRFENPFNTPLKEKRGRLLSTKSDEKQHGYGILGMERIAKRYHGNLSWETENKVFILCVLLQDDPTNDNA